MIPFAETDMSRKILLVFLVCLLAASCASRKKQAKLDAEKKRELMELEAAVAEVEGKHRAKTGAAKPEPGHSPVSVVTPAPERPAPKVVEPAPEDRLPVRTLSKATYEPDASVVGAAVAVVNGDIITKEEVLSGIRSDLAAVERDATLTQIGKATRRKEIIARALMQKVERSLAVQEARRVITPEEADRIEQNVDRLVSDSIRRAGTSTKLEGLLAEKGKTLKETKQAELDNRLIRALLIREVDAHVDVTPAEMRQYYAANRKGYANLKQVKIRQIFLSRSQYTSIDEAVTKARDLRSQIRRGADFGKLAKQHSDGPFADKHGLWEFATEGIGTFPPKVEREAFRLAPKQVSDVIITKLGVHLILVEDVRPARQIPFREVQDEIATKLREQKRKRLYREFIRQIWAKSHVDISWK